MAIVRFYSWIVKIGIALALCGMLKSCTFTIMGLTAEKTERGIISYSKFTRQLTQ